ncbi:MAG: AMP-binding protein, partial [Elusimicrobiota bacterium]
AGAVAAPPVPAAAAALAVLPAAYAPLAQLKRTGAPDFDGAAPALAAAPAEPQRPSDPRKAPFFVRHYSAARAVASPLIRALYGLRVAGRDSLPEGPAVILPNHVSYMDPVLIGYAANRPLRFMMKRSIFNRAPRLFEALGAIPVSKDDAPELIEKSLETARRAIRAGWSVVIFPEGQMTLTGNMNEFRRGFERIVAGAPAPVVPAYVDGLWGSVFSLRSGPSLWSRIQQVRRPVSVRFGPPLSEPSVPAARLAVGELGAAAMNERLERRRRPLAREFFASAKRFWSRRAIADSLGQDLTFGRALTGTVLLGGVLDKKLPGETNVGVLMPPSAAGALANLALASVGRVPVNLNYTASKTAVEHAVASAGITTLVTSPKFLEKLKEEKGFEPPAGARLVFMEDLREEIPKWKQKASYLALRILPRPIAEALFIGKASSSLDDAATILFTSGSSALPKGVVLTQKNVLANVEMLRDVVPWAERDTMLGVLPFFHSFGYTVTLWLPMLSGMSAAYHVHPMQADAIAALAVKVRPTLLLGTPAFLQRYAQKIPPAAFAGLRLAIAGAEKLRDSVADEFQAAFGVRPLEGYGTTELSPVAAVNLPDAGKQKGSKPGSVGRALPGSVIKIVDVNTGRTLPDGEVGMLLVKGPNVMKGYLDEPGKTAEVLQDGWYTTGDLAVMDRSGFVTISGRLSRFSKLAGEMVSHVAVEEKLQQAAGLADQIFVVTGVKDEKRGERLVVLYSGWDGSVDELLAKTRALGVPNLWIPAKSDFRKIERIPLLGTGKLDLKGVNELAAQAGL